MVTTLMTAVLESSLFPCGRRGLGREGGEEKGALTPWCFFALHLQPGRAEKRKKKIELTIPGRF